MKTLQPSDTTISLSSTVHCHCPLFSAWSKQLAVAARNRLHHHLCCRTLPPGLQWKQIDCCPLSASHASSVIEPSTYLHHLLRQCRTPPSSLPSSLKSKRVPSISSLNSVEEERSFSSLLGTKGEKHVIVVGDQVNMTRPNPLNHLQSGQNSRVRSVPNPNNSEKK